MVHILCRQRPFAFWLLLSLNAQHSALPMKALWIPIKDPANAKTRLAGLLTADERRGLAWAMFEDVSRAVSDAAEPDRIVLVSSFARAIDHARRLGWAVLVEEKKSSESASIDWASLIRS